MHGGAAPQVLRKAQERIVMAQDDAASNLVRWMQDESVPFAERRKCAEALLNRGGNSPGQRLEVSMDPAPWQQLIEGIVAEVGDGTVNGDGPLMASLAGEVVEAEVVEPQPLDDPDDVPVLGRPQRALPTPAEPVRIPSRRRRGGRAVGR